MAKKTISTAFFLQLALALTLISFGILAVQGYNSSGAEAMRGLNRMFGKSNNLFPIIFGIIQLAAGIFLCAELFVPIPGNLAKILYIVICVFWIISIVMNFFMDRFMEPDFFRWLAAMAPQLVILFSLWLVGENQ